MRKECVFDTIFMLILYSFQSLLCVLELAILKISAIASIDQK